MAFVMKQITEEEILEYGKEMTDDDIVEADRVAIVEETPILFLPYNFDTKQMLEGTYYDMPYDVPEESEYPEFEKRYTERNMIGKRTSKEIWKSCDVGLGKCGERKDKIGYFVRSTSHDENIEKLQKMYDLGVGMCYTFSEREVTDRIKLTKTLYYASRWVNPTLYLLRWEDLGSLKVYEELLRWYDEERIVCVAGGDPYEVLGCVDFNRVKKIRKIKLKKHKELVEKNRQARHQRRLWKAKTRKLKRQQRLMERVRCGELTEKEEYEDSLLSVTNRYSLERTRFTAKWLSGRKDKYSSVEDDKEVHAIMIDYFKGKIESYWDELRSLRHSSSKL